MKLASLKPGCDGSLVVVSRGQCETNRYHAAGGPRRLGELRSRTPVTFGSIEFRRL